MVVGKSGKVGRNKGRDMGASDGECVAGKREGMRRMRKGMGVRGMERVYR